MVQELEVIHRAEVVAVLEREPDAPGAPPERARLAHEQVADRDAHRMGPVASHRGADEIVRGTVEQRNVPAAVRQERVEVDSAPVLVEQRSEPQILDADAARVQDGGERTRDVDTVEHPGGHVRRLLEWRPVMRRAETDDVAYPSRPFVASLETGVSRAADDQASHAV